MSAEKKKRARRNHGYAARLARRYAELGVGPLRTKEGKQLPWPRPACTVEA